jgi:hypothetical protein
MSVTSAKSNNRKQDRIRAVLPVRVKGKDALGNVFESLAHTLDLTPTGAKLGSIRHELKALDTVTVLFRKRRIEFTIMWIRKLKDCSEYQAGLKALAAAEGDPWGLNLSQPAARPLAAVSAAV